MYPAGFCILEPLKLNRRFASVLVLFAVGSFYLGYSIANEWPDYKKILQIVMTSLILVQALSRFICYILDQKKCIVLRELIVKFHEENDELDEKVWKISMTNFRHLRTSFKIIFILHVVCELLPFFLSLYNFGLNGKKFPPFPAFIPFLDRESSISFFANFMFQLIIAVMFIFANPKADWTYILIITQTKAHVDGIEFVLDKMSVMIEDDSENRSNEKRKMLQENFVQLVEKHRKLVEYFNIASNFITKQFFILISVNIYVICSSGISFLTSEYSVAIGIVIFYPIQIFFVCIMGEFVKHQHERLIALLWDFKWYNLPVRYQKNFAFFLHNVQQPMRLEMLFIGVIDLELYITVRRIYFGF